MPDVFITLEEAAAFEGITYEAMKKRAQRSPKQYKTQTQAREGGGKDQVLISVASLTTKARKAYRAAQKVDGRDVIIDRRAAEATPWYVDADLNHYIESNKKRFYEAVELAARVQDFIDYDGPDRTAYAERFALGLGVSPQTLYRYTQNVLEANPSIKTVARYIKYLMDTPGAESARYLAANGTREWKNKKMVKARRDATSLEVMEYVVGDEHTFDFWVQWTAPNGKVKAVRPKLVAWMDMKSRCIIGDVACVDANSQTLKESLVKMIYSNPGGVPHILHVDNGKDYTAKTMTGQNRKERKIDFSFDAETVGFYQSIGIEDVGRSLPYQPWDKPIERFFKTVCDKFSRWFESYTGTLTGSKTYAKRQKDVDKMLERGELLTMEEFFEVWTTWKETKYHTRVHRGLKDAGEKWVTPIEMFENGPRYEKAAPPREYAAMLLMKADTARVYNYGINKFGTVYSDSELGKYIGQKVGIKWDIDDVTKLYVFDQQGRKICEAVSPELLAFGPHCSQAALEKHLRDQKRQEREVREFLEDMTRPYELRTGEGGRASEAVGMIDLTIKAERSPKLVFLPNDKEFRAEAAAATKKKKTNAGDEFLASKAGDALARLRAMNE